MGLDMFLEKVKREDGAYWRKANAINKWFCNHIADGELENCRRYQVTRADLYQLMQDCKKVLDSSNLVYKEHTVSVYDFEKKDYVKKNVFTKVLEDTSVAEEILPAESGFFYGSTEYDEGYIEDLESTIKQINDILTETDQEYDYEYFAWW